MDADPRRSLLGVLRDELDLTGAKYGCGEGRCGACTVLVDGQAVRSCTARVGAVAERRITTIEGIAEKDGRLHPLQQAFLDCNAMQCGYCTAGMLMSAVSILEDDPAPKRDDIARLMNVNVCRCGTYQRIVSAIEQAARVMKGGAQ